MDWPDEDTPIAFSPALISRPAREITPVKPMDPAKLGYPPTFPIEIAMRNSTVMDICEAYHIEPEEWDLIRNDPVFLGDLQRAIDMLKEEGMGFRVKARLQAEELLQTSWNEIHNPATPPAVRADLIKSTVRWAQYDAPNSQGVASGTGFHISFNFSGEAPKMKTING